MGPRRRRRPPLPLGPPRVLALPLLLLLCVAAGMQAGTAADAEARPQESPRPNIVFILADDLGWNDVGYRNRENEDVLQTPNIDALAREGVVLDNYYVQVRARAMCTDGSSSGAINQAPPSPTLRRSNLIF